MRARILRMRRPHFELYTPVDCFGEIGAAIGPCLIGLSLDAARKGYAPGPGVLCHFASDDGVRAALILREKPHGDPMADEVYANGRDVACKAGDGKSICAFPDVCLSRRLRRRARSHSETRTRAWIPIRVREARPW